MKFLFFALLFFVNGQIDFSNFNFINDLDSLINNDSIDIPNIIVSSLEYYLKLIKETNANFYQKEIEFFEQINKSIDIYKTIDDTKEKIGILKETLNQLINKLISTSNIDYKNDTLLLLSNNLLEKINNYEAKFLSQIYQQIKNKVKTPTSPTSNNEIIKSDLSKIKLVDTKFIDQQMFVILIIMITILTVVGFYLITKKRLKKTEIEKTNKKYTKQINAKLDSEEIPLNNKVIKDVGIHQDNSNKESSQLESVELSHSTSTSS